MATNGRVRRRRFRETVTSRRGGRTTETRTKHVRRQGSDKEKK